MLASDLLSSSTATPVATAPSVPPARFAHCIKYRYQVLHGALRERVRAIIRQVCEEPGVTIVGGVLSSDHVHMFVSIPPKLSVGDVVRRLKGRSSCKIQQEFPDIRKRYWAAGL